ncbi:MAG TPA: serine hydrolase domain-containing protein, partial [Luteolibacter sp.]|nr:serine hydrolase domain-containing protein [Luteolibacter sp.]
EKRLFGPLGMKDTSFYPGEDQVKRMALSYNKTGNGLEPVLPRVLAGKEYGDPSRYPRANGGLFSTAEDYGKFLSMILNGGEANGRRFLKPETIAAMIRSRTDAVENVDNVGFVKGNTYGIGWIQVKSPGGATAALSPGSSGHGGAYGTQGWIDPVKGRYTVMIIQHANIGNGDNSEIRGKFQAAAAK